MFMHGSGFRTAGIQVLHVYSYMVASEQVHDLSLEHVVNQSIFLSIHTHLNILFGNIYRRHLRFTLNELLTAFRALSVAM